MSNPAVSNPAVSNPAVSNLSVPSPSGSRTILRIDASATGANSATRALTDQLVERLATADDRIVVRDLALGVPLLTEHVTANMGVAPADRAPDAERALAFADELIAELREADVVVIGAPIYNFGVPAALKAWGDLVARAGETFAYSEQGPVGLLEDRPAFVVAAAGGTPIGSELDHGTTWLTMFLRFLGIQDVSVIAAEGLAIDPAGGLARAGEAIAAIA